MRLSNHWSVQGASPASCPPVPSPFRSGGPRNFYSTLRATGASETFTKKETCLYREEKREVKHIPKRRRRSSVSYTTTRQRERKRCGGGRRKKKKRKKKKVEGRGLVGRRDAGPAFGGFLSLAECAVSVP